MPRIHVYVEGFLDKTAFADITDEQMERLSPQEISERFCVPAIAYLKHLKREASSDSNRQS